MRGIGQCGRAVDLAGVVHLHAGFLVEQSRSVTMFANIAEYCRIKYLVLDFASQTFQGLLFVFAQFVAAIWATWTMPKGELTVFSTLE